MLNAVTRQVITTYNYNLASPTEPGNPRSSNNGSDNEL